MSEQIQPIEPEIELAHTSWPKVVGILSIVWGGLGLTCLACGVGSLLFMPAMLPEEMRNQPLPPNMRIAVWQAVMFAIGFVMSILLIVAGVQTLNRSMAGRSLHMIWAVASILLTLVNIYFGWKQMIEMEQWMNDNPDSKFAQGPRMSRGTSTAMIVGLNSIGLVWPAFCLIWFGAVKRTQASFGAAAPKDFI